MPDMARYDPFSPTFDHPLINSSPDYGSRTTSFRNRVVGDLGAVGSQMSFRERNKRLRSLDEDKNQLIEVSQPLLSVTPCRSCSERLCQDLLYQLETTQTHVERLQLDYNREAEYNREAHRRESSLVDQLGQVKTIMVSNIYPAGQNLADVL